MTPAPPIRITFRPAADGARCASCGTTVDVQEMTVELSIIGTAADGPQCREHREEFLSIARRAPQGVEIRLRGVPYDGVS